MSDTSDAFPVSAGNHIKTAKQGLPYKKTIIGISVIVLLLALGLGIRTYNLNRFHLEKDVRLMMDTFVTIYAVGPRHITRKAIDLAFERMEEIDRKFSIHNPEGPIWQFNHNGTPITDPEILEVVRFALDLNEKTNGAFDITASPLSELWGFYGDTPRLPLKAEIEQCLENVGAEHLMLKDSQLEKSREGVRIDLGAIAKGYNIRMASETLKANGVTSALIDAGGDVYGLGKKGNSLWKVGIRSPREKGLLGYFQIEDLSVMGSGDYERFFMENGQRYHHIMNPLTGYPVRGLSGITLIAPDPMSADAWATAVFVMGPEKGLETVEKIPGMEVLMVTDTGNKLLSSGLQGQLQQLPKSK